MADLPLEAATADVIARFKRGNDMLASAAIALRRLKERVDAGEAGSEWSWTSYSTMHLEAHITKRWINAQLKLAPPGATDDEVAKNVEQQRKTKRLGMKKSREPRGSNLIRTMAYDQSEPEYEEPVRQTEEGQDDREVGDSDRHLADSQSREAVPDASRGNTAPAAEEDPVEAGGAEWKPPHFTVHPEGMVAYWLDPNDKARMVATAVTILVRVSKEITPTEATTLWPSNVPMAPDDFEALALWIDKTSNAFREEYPNGNDAALQAAE